MCAEHTITYECTPQLHRFSNPVVKHQLKADLEDYFRVWRIQHYGMLTKADWTNSYHWTCRIESTAIPPSAMDYWNVYGSCNKSIVLYWASAAQFNGQCPMLPYGCIYKYWYRYFDDRPKVDFGHFFANPIQITPTSPQTITEMLGAHKSLCYQVSSFLDMVRQGEAQHED